MARGGGRDDFVCLRCVCVLLLLRVVHEWSCHPRRSRAGHPGTAWPAPCRTPNAHQDEAGGLGWAGMRITIPWLAGSHHVLLSHCKYTARGNQLMCPAHRCKRLARDTVTRNQRAAGAIDTDDARPNVTRGRCRWHAPQTGAEAHRTEETLCSVRTQA